jgi:RND family efflux transporter MFP subunit
MKRLVDQDVVARQRLDQAQMAYDVAKAGYEAAVEQADMTEEGSREEDIKTAQARVRQAEESLRLARAAVVQNKIREEQARTAASEVGRASAALQYARVQHSYATITSPVDGIVTARLVDPGATVSPGAPILTIENRANYRLEAGVSESDLPLLAIGALVDVQIDASGMEVRGRVVEIVPSGDPGSRKFTVKVDLPKGMVARTGQFGRVRFPRSTREAVTVSSEAVRDATGITSVFVAGSDGKAHLQVVKAGKSEQGRTEIVSGLSGGEEVITSGLSALSDGTPIRRR